MKKKLIIFSTITIVMAIFAASFFWKLVDTNLQLSGVRDNITYRKTITNEDSTTLRENEKKLEKRQKIDTIVTITFVIAEMSSFGAAAYTYNKYKYKKEK